MANALPTGPRGRLLALGLSVLTVATLWLGVAAPLLEWHAERAERLERQRALAQRMAGLVETLPVLRARAAAAAAASPTAAALLEGRSDALAGAALQGRVQELALQAGAALASAEGLPTEQVGDFRRIALRVTLTASWPALVELLRAIEAAAPRMLVDDLQMQPAPAIQVTGRPLSVTMTVLAFRVAESTAAARQ